MRVRRLIVTGAVAASLLAGCSDDGAGEDTAPPTTVHEVVEHEVEHSQETFVDADRPTPANGGIAEQNGRTIVTDVLRPAGDDGAPFPLVVFAHGLGGSFDFYEPLLREWTAAGFVVAAPRFPQTYAGTEGGLNPADVENQPGDISFVIDELLEGELGELIDDDAIGAAGHSNGAITTLGLVANSCCRDRRLDGAVVMAGTPSPYSGGKYDLTDTPPLLVVHGTEDALVDYREGVNVFNAVEGPKGLVTLEEGDHGGWLQPDSDAFESVVDATVDFWRATLRSDGSAADRLPDDGVDGLVTVVWAGEEGASTTIPTIPPPETDRRASASRTDGLRDGDVVEVAWSGFSKGTVNIVQCTGDGTGGSATCAISGGIILHDDPAGGGRLPLRIIVGPVGSGVCDTANPCSILVNDSGSQEPGATIYLPITFA